MMSNEFSNKFDETPVVYANITEENREKLTQLEHELQKETGEKVALVAYRI